MPIDELIEQRILRPLGMASTTLPRPDDSPRGHLPPAHKSRARARLFGDGKPSASRAIRSYYHWPGTGQMFSSPRDMTALLAADLDELPLDQSQQDATALAHVGFRIGPRNSQALAWEIPARLRLSTRTAASTTRRPISGWSQAEGSAS